MMIDVIHSKGWTFFPSAREAGPFWEGTIAVYVEGSKRRMVHICLGSHDAAPGALLEAVVDSLVLADMV
jgi:hypothetical protein